MDSLPSFWVSCFPWGDSSGFKFLSPVPSALTSVSGPRGTSIIKTDSCCLPCCLSSGWSWRLAKKKTKKKQVILFCEDSRVSHFYFNTTKTTFGSYCNPSPTPDSNSSITFSIHSLGMGYKQARQLWINHGQQQRHFLQGMKAPT